jgi:hypothetical protein
MPPDKRDEGAAEAALVGVIPQPEDEGSMDVGEATGREGGIEVRCGLPKIHDPRVLAKRCQPRPRCGRLGWATRLRPSKTSSSLPPTALHVDDRHASRRLASMP